MTYFNDKYTWKDVALAIFLFLGSFIFYIFLPELSSYGWFKIAVVILLAGITFYVFINHGFAGLLFLMVWFFLAFSGFFDLFE